MDPTLIPSDGSAAERPEETGGGLALDPEADPPLLKMDALRKANPKFRRSWEQDRKDMTDQSPSAYDMSMATMAMQAGWSDQEVVNLMICWRRKHGHDLKLRENYYLMTLDKARKPIEIAQAEEQLNEALAQPPEDQPEVLKDTLKTLFRVGIVKYAGDPPIYHMYTKQGDITLGEINSITSQAVFRKVQALLLACEEIDAGDASHPTQETSAWLEEYLLKKPPREEDEWEKAAEARQPFIRRGKVHIFLDDFRKWLDLNDEPATSHALRRRLRQYQARTEKINIKVGNTLTSRTTWQLPERYPGKPVTEGPVP